MSPRRRPRKLTRRNLRQHTSRPENVSAPSQASLYAVIKAHSTNPDTTC
jgi:hypothetical protein